MIYVGFVSLTTRRDICNVFIWNENRKDTNRSTHFQPARVLTLCKLLVYTELLICQFVMVLSVMLMHLKCRGFFTAVLKTAAHLTWRDFSVFSAKQALDWEFWSKITLISISNSTCLGMWMDFEGRCFNVSCDGWVVKVLDSKSNRVSLRRFKSCSQRGNPHLCLNV